MSLIETKEVKFYSSVDDFPQVGNELCVADGQLHVISGGKLGGTRSYPTVSDLPPASEFVGVEQVAQLTAMSNGIEWFLTGAVEDIEDLPIAYKGNIFIKNYGIGGSRWHNNGIGWKPDGNVILQQSLADISCDGGTTVYTMVVSPRIPAGLLLAGSKLSIKLRSSKSGTAANLDYKFLLSNNADGSSGVVCSDAIRIAAANAATAAELDLVIRSETEIQQIQHALTGTTPYGSITTASLNQRYTGLPNVSSTDIYVVLARVAKTGADVGTLYYYEVVLS